MKTLIHRLHVWCGAGSGLLILLLCLSGSLAVFRLEISQWVSGGLSAPANCTLAADAVLATLRTRLQEAPDSGGLLRRLSLPELTGGYWELRLANGERAQADLCGHALQGPRSQAADFLVNLHTRLLMGKAGRWIVGLFGVLMLLSLVSGVLLHRKVLRQLFTLRAGKSPRLVRSDGHKLLGTWLLPFLLLTAFSGAWLGLATLVSAPEIKGVKAAATPAYTTPTGLEQMLDDARQQLPGLVPVFIDFFPDRGHVSVRGNLPGHLVQRRGSVRGSKRPASGRARPAPTRRPALVAASNDAFAPGRLVRSELALALYRAGPGLLRADLARAVALGRPPREGGRKAAAAG